MKDARHETMDAFLDRAGWRASRREPLPGDASTRRYIRLRQGERTALLMDQPQAAETAVAPADATPEQRAALGYNAVARLAGADVARFVAAAKYLRQQGLAAPDIYDADVANGFLLIEDLGDAIYADVLAEGADEQALYAAAIEALVQLHGAVAPLRIAPDTPLYVYDETALLAEIDLLTQWFLPAALKRQSTALEISEHRALWRAALGNLGSVSPVFVHRDYHAQNLLWLPARRGTGRVGLIDFQDALAGSAAYDVISLLEDARRDVSPALRQAMMEHYLAQARKKSLAVTPEQFRAEAAFFAGQRNAKIIGIFARLARRDGKMRYLSLLPRVWGHMESDLAHPAMRAIQDFYGRLIPQSARGELSLEGAPT